MKTSINSIFKLLILLIIGMNLPYSVLCQSRLDSAQSGKLYIGGAVGYDIPLFNLPYEELDYDNALHYSVKLGHQTFKNIGIEAEYLLLSTKPKHLIPSAIYYGTTPISTTREIINLKRSTVSLGPFYRLSLIDNKLDIYLKPKIGLSFISGGDAYAESSDSTGTSTDVHLVNSGFKSNAIAGKFDLDFSFRFTKNLSLNLSAYYLRHFHVHTDPYTEINNLGELGISHGESIFDHTVNDYTHTTNPPSIVTQEPEKNYCHDLSSIGASIGLSYTFHKQRKNTKKACNNCCPDDKHRVIITVRDELSQKIIPNADVVLKNLSGDVVATAKSNSYGIADFGEIPHENYIVEGKVYGVLTKTTNISKDEFIPNTIVRKEILYSDLRFILKGKVTNKTSHLAEPNVVVSLTNTSNKNVEQDNSNAQGQFAFHIDANSSYEVVGIKENRLSDIERASTIGLTRSTTLFVDLELGVENFDCNHGTILDIKYEFDSAEILPESKFELDRLVRYMNDHKSPSVELSSHTDARGSHEYNRDLSQRRAQSAVDYIMERGISRSRITARGFGETQPLNRCVDGVNCSEEEHRINRRTEAKLICK